MKKILVVDDDQDLLRGLAVRLRASGYEVIFAADAMYAVSNARKERPDLIILDIGLPGGDGFLVMDRLKSNSALSSIPIIILSARDPQVNREKALEHGAVAFLQKPADNFVLMATIQKVLGDEPPKLDAEDLEEKPEPPKPKPIPKPQPIENVQPQEPSSPAPEIDDDDSSAPEIDLDNIDYSPVTLKADENIPLDKISPKPVETQRKPKSILVVDDDHDLLLGMSVRLMAYGYNVFFTYDVISAIAKAKKVRPDLIILDIGLPGGDGFTVMERMKKIPEIANTPVIILTAREPQKNRQKAKEMGAVGFFQKPANNNELIKAIRAILD